MSDFGASVRLLACAIALSTAVAVQGLASQSRPDRVLDHSSPLPYFVADGRGRAGYLPGDEQLAVWALGSWQRSSGNALTFVAAPEARAVLRVYWADPMEGQYGEMRPIVVDGRRGAAVYIRPDVTALGEDVAQRARQDRLFRDTIVHLTCVHELGHALGLEHTSDYRDIMYSFVYGGDLVEYFARYRRQLTTREDMARVSSQSAADIGRVRDTYPPRAPR